MNLPDLLRTSAFRLTLLYVALFALSMAALLGFVYWNAVSYLNEQTDRGIAAEMDGLRAQYRNAGIANVRQTVLQRSQAFDDAEQIYLLTAPGGARLAGNLSDWPASDERRAGWALLIAPVWEDDEAHAEGVRVRSLTVTLPGGYRLLVGRNLHDRDEFYAHTLQVLAAAGGLSLVIAVLGGLAMSRGILRRIETINRTGRAIVAGHLERRVPVTRRGDEFDQLAANLNAMLDRIQRLMEGMRQVTDNVAHDLRSPLNRLRSRLEVTLLAARDDADYRAAIEQTLGDIDGLLRTFDALLGIAQAESGADRGNWEHVDLSAVVRDIAELYRPLAEDRGLEFVSRIERNLRLQSNRHLLAQALSNLLDNAIKYTPRGGAVELDLNKCDDGPVVTVCDNGPGIPAVMRDMVLERFVRLEASRTTPGNGLGLSMVRAVARLHGAALTLSDNRPGLRVSLKFPVTASLQPKTRIVAP